MMGSTVEGKIKTLQPQHPSTLLEEMKLLKEMQEQSGSSIRPWSRKCINSELWHACAGPLASLPQLGSLVYYFPQGHSEQVAVSTKRSATAQIPNYPNLPSQLLCQVHNVTLHADKETDEIYAQMTLQPVNSEKDVFPVPDFGLKPSRHPSEFFCKTLTASDTSTHGGFSVPRRAAEKLFPPLDYTMQPPTQELVVKDLHDNTWTFRHIYRGQPKRHLLTTGWSLFVGAKRLRAGDSVLFIRDEKSQLLVGVRHANRQQTTLPSSVLSADSMHIGILAAAAHAATNQSSFTIFYNPRACPSEFVVPLVKYRKAVYGTRISVGMRFGMMFETEESGKRRYMGTIIGLSDLDPLRWPGSKWRNLQVEWDEPGCLDKQNRVSTWEVETPESLFIFPSLTSGLKRPFSETDWGNLIKRPLMQFPENGHGRGTFLPYSPVPNLCSEQLIKMILKPPQMGAFPLPRDVDSKVPVPLQEFNYNMSDIVNKKQDQSSTVCSSPQVVGGAAKEESPSKAETQVLEAEKLKLDPEYKIGPGLMNQMLPVGECNGENLWACLLNQQNNHICPPPTFINQNQAPIILQPNSSPATQAINVVQTDQDGLQGSSSLLNAEEWMVNPVIPQSLAGLMRSQSSPSVLSMQDQSPSFIDPMAQILPSMGAEIWDPTGNLQYLSQVDQLTPLPEQDPSSLCCISNSVSVRDLSDESNNESGIYNCLKGGSYIVDPSVSSAILDEFCSMKDVRFQNPSDCMVGGTFSSSQDVQSQITSASLVDVQPLPPRDLRDSSGVTSSSNVDFDDNSLLKNNCSWQQVAPLPPMRTYTKVQKAGSVGRSIDVTNFKNYEELLSAIECMFGLEGVLNDPRGSGWKLVYVDYENDVLLVGDDPWEEFVGCVRCIRILSPAEVQQMSEEGMELLNSAAAQGLNGGRACFIR